MGTIEDDAIGSSRQATILRKRSVESFLIQHYTCSVRMKNDSRFRRIGQLIIRKARTITDGIGSPRLSIQIHQSQQQARVYAPAQQQAKRHIAQEMSFHCLFVEFEQFVLSLADRLCRRKWGGFDIDTTAARCTSPFSHVNIVPGASFIIP